MKRVTLKQARMDREWSQAKLAELSGVPAPHISQIESGTIRQPEMATMEKLADALSMTALLSVAGLVFEERETS